MGRSLAICNVKSGRHKRRICSRKLWPIVEVIVARASERHPAASCQTRSVKSPIMCMGRPFAAIQPIQTPNQCPPKGFEGIRGRRANCYAIVYQPQQNAGIGCGTAKGKSIRTHLTVGPTCGNSEACAKLAATPNTPLHGRKAFEPSFYGL